jgi:hypothetical protein
MNTKTSPFNILFFAILWVFTNPLMAHEKMYGLDHELKKYYTKEYTVNDGDKVSINNRYGKIEVKTWAKQSVKIDVHVIVKASTKSKAEEKHEEIKIYMDKTGNKVSGRTEIESSNQSWWSSWWNNDTNVKLEINYTVFMPDDLDSFLENKYGNIYLPDLKAKTNIVLKYGNLQASNMNDDCILELGYGKATFGTLKNLTATIAYSDITCTSGDAMVITSKYSKVQADQLKKLISTSKYDTYKVRTLEQLTMTGAYNDIEIGSVYNATVTLKYTGLDIDNLGGSMTADLSYGSMTIQALKNSFKKMVVSSSYAPVKIYGSVPSKIDISGKYFDASLGSDFTATKRDVDGSSKFIQGYKGSERTGASITISTSYGDVMIK